MEIMKFMGLLKAINHEDHEEYEGTKLSDERRKADEPIAKEKT